MIKHRIGKIIIAAILTFCSQMAFASEWVEISEFTVWASNYEDDVIRVEVAGDKVNPSSCSNPDSYMVLETLSDGIQQRIYSLLLAAHMVGEPVTAKVGGCQDDRPAIITVVMGQR